MSPDGKKLQPSGQIQYSMEYTKQPEKSRNTWTGTVYSEIPLGNFPLSFFASMPWHYYEQKNRKDASRYGKPAVGARLSFLDAFSDTITGIADFKLGIPTGADTDTFTSENYWDGGIGLSLGGGLGPVYLIGRVGGIFPLSKLEAKKQDNPAFSLEQKLESLSKTADEEQLKPVTEARVSASVRLFEGFNTFASAYYRTPHDGIVWTNQGTPPTPLWTYLKGETVQDYWLDKTFDEKESLPGHYEEFSVGFYWRPVEHMSLGISYAVPGYDRPGVRPFASNTMVTFTWEFGSLHYHSAD